MSRQSLAHLQYRKFNPEDSFKKIIDRHNILNHELFSGGFYDTPIENMEKICSKLEAKDYIWITKDSEELPVRCGITNNVDYLREFIFKDNEKFVKINYLWNDPDRHWAKKYKQELKRIITFFTGC